MTSEQGYYPKYTVFDNRTGEQVEDRTFTFNLDKDMGSWYALDAYRDYLELNGKSPELVRDLKAMIVDSIGTPMEEMR
jgi:hypothetical protein